MICDRIGSMFDSGADAMVCPVNGVRTMGKGLALEFARRFPGLEDDYRRACAGAGLVPGKIGSTGATGRDGVRRVVILLPTKYEWRNPSRLSYVYAGLGQLILFLEARPLIRSVAIPALGCGLGGLPWERVRPMIAAACELLPGRTFYLYPPGDQG